MDKTAKITGNIAKTSSAFLLTLPMVIPMATICEVDYAEALGWYGSVDVSTPKSKPNTVAGFAPEQVAGAFVGGLAVGVAGTAIVAYGMKKRRNKNQPPSQVQEIQDASRLDHTSQDIENE